MVLKNKGGGWKGGCGGKGNLLALMGAEALMGGGMGFSPREQMMMSMMEMMMGGKGGGGGFGGKGKGGGFGKKGGQPQKKPQQQQQKQAKQAAPTPVADMPWKSRLGQAWAQTNRAPCAKDTIAYSTVDAEDEVKGFISTVACGTFKGEHSSDQVYPTKKLAEEAAAMVALKEEFPEIYDKVPDTMRNEGAMGGATGQSYIREQQAQQELNEGTITGVKRKASEMAVANQPKGTQPTDGKSKLNTAMMIICERPLVKEDIEYAVQEGGGSVTGTVKLNCLDGAPTIKGKPVTAAGEVVSKDNKKDAMNNAAVAAFNKYQALYKKKLPAHEAKKAARQAEYEARKIAEGKVA